MEQDQYVANARMYAATPVIARMWEKLFVRTAHISGVPLHSEPHAWPADIEALWARPDLGLTFICGKPFRNAGARHKPIAVPLPHNRPASPDPDISLYCTHFLVRADSPWQTLPDSFGSRLGWTVPHSQSGYNAVRYTLVNHVADGLPFSATVGPLHTPNRCLEALLSREADVVPMDSYYHTLLTKNCPSKLAGTRVLASSPAAPMPFFAASPETPDEVCRVLRDTLCAFTPDTLLNELALDGFAPVKIDAYTVLDMWESLSNKAGVWLENQTEPQNIS